MNITAYSFIDPTGFRRVGATQSDSETQKVLSQYPEIYDVTIEKIQQGEFDAWRDAHDIQPTGPKIQSM